MLRLMFLLADLGTGTGVGWSSMTLTSSGPFRKKGPDGCRPRRGRTSAADLALKRRPRKDRRNFQGICNIVQRVAVAVGTAVARRPPHGSRRAELPHRALALDHERQTHV